MSPPGAQMAAAAAAEAAPQYRGPSEELPDVVRHPIRELVRLDFGGMKFVTSVDTLTSGEGENFFK